jgi:hypothetical protein
MKNIAEMTPKEVDTILADLYYKEIPHLNRIMGLNESLRLAKATKEISATGYTMRRTTEIEHDLVIERMALAKIRAEAQPFEDEYIHRFWKRYFLVTAGGHVHRGRDCSTCYPTTVYGWLPELSGCDESEMVREYGETACTVCFPEAPTMWKLMGCPKGKLAREVEAVRAASQAKKDETARIKAIKAISNPDGSPLKGAARGIETLAAAKSELLGTAGSLKYAQEGSYNWDRRAEILAAYDRIAEAIAYKLNITVEAVKTEAEKKVTKRGY